MFLVILCAKHQLLLKITHPQQVSVVSIVIDNKRNYKEFGPQ